MLKFLKRKFPTGVMNNAGLDCRPRTPPDSDCCGNGCDPCILDVQKKLAEQWEKRKLQNIPFKPENNLLLATKYRRFSIEDIAKATVDCVLLQLDYKGVTEYGTRLFLRPGQHVMLRGETVSRPLTPISWTNNSLLFIVKIYPNGIFSKYVERMKVGDQIDVRGPYGEFFYSANSFKDIVMFGIGTGIAPLYPIARSIVDDDSDETKIHLVAGFHSFGRIPLLKEIRELTDYWNFACLLRLTEPSNGKGITGVQLENGLIEKSTVSNVLKSRSPESTLILICGTSKFNENMKQCIEELNYSHFHIFK